MSDTTYMIAFCFVDKDCEVIMGDSVYMIAFCFVDKDSERL